MFSADLQALVFDFDRTLAPLGNFVKWREALPLMRERYRAHGVPEAHLDSAPRGCFGLFGHVARGDHLAPDVLARAQVEVSQILAKYEAAGIGQVELFAGSEALLRALPVLGLRAGIVSSNPEWVIRDVLEHRDVSGCFEAIVGRDGLRHIKPDPEGMLLCCQSLGVQPASCLGVGDNAGDIEASRAAGMPAVGVATGVSKEPELLAAGALAVYDGIPALHAALGAWKALR